MNMSFDYSVPGVVPAIAQPSTLACWATVATMLISWRNGSSPTIQEAMDGVGEPYRSYFKNNRVLPWSEHDSFATAAGMTLEGPMCYSVDGLFHLLHQAAAPLFTVIAPAGSTWTTHIVAITGMFGDGTVSGTSIRFNDPNGGQRRVLTFDQFVSEYEGAATRPGLNVQIMHY